MSTRSKKILNLALYGRDNNNSDSQIDHRKYNTLNTGCDVNTSSAYENKNQENEPEQNSIAMTSKNADIQACAAVKNNVFFTAIDDIPIDLIGINIVEQTNFFNSVELNGDNITDNISPSDDTAHINTSLSLTELQTPNNSYFYEAIQENSSEQLDISNLDILSIPTESDLQGNATIDVSDHSDSETPSDSELDKDYVVEENNNTSTNTSDDNDEVDTHTHDDHEVGRFDRSILKRSLVAEPENWKRSKNKKLRMRGEQYIGFKYNKESKKSSQDQVRSGRKLKPRCSSSYCLKAKNRQCSEVTEDTRVKIFEDFWSKMTWDQRKIYVSSNVRKQTTKEKTTDLEKSRRSGTFLYFIDAGEKKFQVCRNTFLNTFDIGYKMIHHWVNSSEHGMHEDTQTRLSKMERIKTENKECYVYLNNFLDSLPKLPSHYARKESTKLFLEPVFYSKTDVYKLYKEKCATDSNTPYSIKVFNRMFKQKNLSIYQLKKDQCNICSSHKVGMIPEEQWIVHNKRKQLARDEKNRDKELANENQIIALTMDLQAVKLSPWVTANKFYFKTKLCSHNFTVFNLKTHHVACYWFSEDQNSELKASTFVSCIIDYLQKNCLTETKTPIVLWSDGCTYQNRNTVMANALLNFSMIHGIPIYQKYLEVGHTQMECDSVHALIERKLRNKEIYLPSDYVRISREARPKAPYDCYDLEYTFFKDYASAQHQRFHSIRPGKKPSDPVVTDIKAIMYRPEGIIQVRAMCLTKLCSIKSIRSFIILGEAWF